MQNHSRLTMITLSPASCTAEPCKPGKSTWTITWHKCQPDAFCFQPSLENLFSPITLFPRFRVESKIIQAPSAFFRPIQLKKYYPNYAELNYQPSNGIECNTAIMLENPDTLIAKFSFFSQLETAITVSLEWFLFNTSSAARQGVPLKNEKGAFLHMEHGQLILQTCFHGGSTYGQESIPSLLQSMRLEPETRNNFILYICQGQTSIECQKTLHGAKGKNWDALMAYNVFQNSASLMQIETNKPEWNELLHFSQVHAKMILNELKLAPETGNRKTQVHSLFELKHGMNICGNGLAFLFKDLLTDFLSNQEENGQPNWLQPLPNHGMEGMAFPIAMDMTYKIFLQTRDLEWLKSIYPKLKIGLQAWFTPTNDKDNDGCPEWSSPSQAGIEESILIDQYSLLFHPYHFNKMENPGLLNLLYDEQCIAAKLAEYLQLPDDAAEWREYAKKTWRRLDQFWQGHHKGYQVLDYEAHHNHSSIKIQKGMGDAHLIMDWHQVEQYRIKIIISLQETYTRPIRIRIIGSARGKRLEEAINYSKLIWQKKEAIGITDSVYDHLEDIQILGLHADEPWTIQTLHFHYKDISMLFPLLKKETAKNKKRASAKHSIFEKGCNTFGFPTLLDSEKTIQTHCIASIPWNTLLIEKMLDHGELSSAVCLFEKIMAAASLQLSKESCVSSYYDCHSGAGFGKKNTIPGLIPVSLFLRLAGIQKITQEEIIITHFNPFKDRFTVQYKGIKLTLLPDLVEVSCRGLTDILTQPGIYRICFPLNVVK